ncbi:MAG: hypothetical protein ABW164_11825, partial [Sphingobium sp.]
MMLLGSLKSMLFPASAPADARAVTDATATDFNILMNAQLNAPAADPSPESGDALPASNRSHGVAAAPVSLPVVASDEAVSPSQAVPHDRPSASAPADIPQAVPDVS